MLTYYILNIESRINVCFDPPINELSIFTGVIHTPIVNVYNDTLNQVNSSKNNCCIFKKGYYLDNQDVLEISTLPGVKNVMPSYLFISNINNKYFAKIFTIDMNYLSVFKKNMKNINEFKLERKNVYISKTIISDFNHNIGEEINIYNPLWNNQTYVISGLFEVNNFSVLIYNNIIIMDISELIDIYKVDLNEFKYNFILIETISSKDIVELSRILQLKYDNCTIYHYGKLDDNNMNTLKNMYINFKMLNYLNLLSMTILFFDLYKYDDRYNMIRYIIIIILIQTIVPPVTTILINSVNNYIDLLYGTIFLANRSINIRINCLILTLFSILLVNIKKIINYSLFKN